MKPIVIAGNGPSLAQIDYSRLPQDFDVFRCNQFYFEDKYFLGKKIKAVFFIPVVFQEQYFTLHHLKERGEYEVEEVYCNTDRELGGDFNYYFPFVKNTYDYLKQLPKFLQTDRFYRLFYHQWMTSGIAMLITALAQGYQEIYLTGIDFYGEGKNYAFDMSEKKIRQKISEFNNPNYQRPHSLDLDSLFIKLALSLPDVKIYCLSQNSPLVDIVPLAPRQNQAPMQVLPKPQGYICDFIPSPIEEVEIEEEKSKTEEKKIRVKKRGLIQKVKFILMENGIFDKCQKNLFFIALRDFIFCFKALVVLLKGLLKTPK